MPQFNDAQMIEIARIRERLEAYCNKVQPYPAEPEEDKPVPQLVQHIVRHASLSKQEFDFLQQTSFKIENLNQKLTEHLQPRKKPQPKKSESMGIEIK